MRIRRSVSRVFAALVLPAVCTGVGAYFGWHAIWGERGVLALQDAQAQLGVRKEQLVAIRDRRARLEHRIALMRPGQVDPDLVEELARQELMDGQPGEVAVPRKP